MVKELKDRDEKRKSFSRRRRFHDEKDIDSINDRNEHFNKKIERAFGKYTLEIKNNLERGTALPDWDAPLCTQLLDANIILGFHFSWSSGCKCGRIFSESFMCN